MFENYTIYNSRNLFGRENKAWKACYRLRSTIVEIYLVVKTSGGAVTKFWIYNSRNLFGRENRLRNKRASGIYNSRNLFGRENL